MTTVEWLSRGRDLDDQIYELQTRFINTQRELLDEITKLPDRVDRTILIDFFVNGKSMAEIAEEFGCAYKTVLRMRGAALRHLEELIENGEIVTEKRR